MTVVIEMLSCRGRGALLGVIVSCAIAHVACGYGRESSRPQAAPDTYEIIQGRMTFDGAEETLTGARVSRTFFSAMGEHALIGRLFVDEEYRQDSTQVVILTHMLWKDRFGARPDIIGRTVQLDGRPATVIAVTQPNFSAPERAMFLLPRPAP